MANGTKVMRHASALKAHRQSLVRKARNYQVRNRVRTLTSRVLKDIAEKNLEAAQVSFKVAQSAWQKASKTGVFDRNAASRKISRLASKIASLKKAA
jgi:small subunit ribosomal protein S20